nr:amidohydrolase family protein [Clostridioides difficile]
MATGGVTTDGVEPGSPQLTLEEMKAAVDEAIKAGKITATHAQGRTGIKKCSACRNYFYRTWCLFR